MPSVTIELVIGPPNLGSTNNAESYDVDVQDVQDPDIGYQVALTPSGHR
jgi:hypothetical protein